MVKTTVKLQILENEQRLTKHTMFKQELQGSSCKYLLH
jgi:hypothetical protein